MAEPHVQRLLPLHPKDYLILFALVAEDRHGYGLVKDVEHLSGGTVRMDPANLYRSLRRMVRDGLVEETRRPAADPSDARRRYYHLTDLGERVVTAEAERLDRLAAAARAKRLIPRSESAR